MKYLPLSEVCKINMGQSPESSSYNKNGDGLPFFQGNADFGERYPVTRVWCNAPTKIAHAGDILISVRAPIGAMNYVADECCIGRGLAAITPDSKKVSSEFIFWLLKGKNTELNSKGTGSTFKAIGRKVLEEVLVPDIGFEKQTEYAQVLETVYAIIRERTEQLHIFDKLIKARFVEMFGDPVSNPKGWRVIPWEGVFDTKTGKLDSNAAVEGGEYPFFTCAKEWLWIDKYAYDCEALLLAGNNAAGVYDVKHYKGKFNAYQRTYILQLKDADWSYSLFKYQLEDRLQYLQSQSKGTNTRYLTMGILNSLTFIVPPKELQDEFTTLVSQVDKSKAVVQKALDEAQLLFDSLMQQYFG